MKIMAAKRLEAADGNTVKKQLKGPDLKNLKLLVRLAKALDIKHLDAIFKDIEEDRVVFNLASDVAELCDNIIEEVEKLKSSLKSKLTK